MNDTPGTNFDEHTSCSEVCLYVFQYPWGRNWRSLANELPVAHGVLQALRVEGWAPEDHVVFVIDLATVAPLAQSLSVRHA